MRTRRGEPDQGAALLKRRGAGGGSACPERPAQLQEIDRALLRWLAERLATAGPEACAAEINDYLIAEALGELQRGAAA